MAGFVGIYSSNPSKINNFLSSIKRMEKLLTDPFNNSSRDIFVEKDHVVAIVQRPPIDMNMVHRKVSEDYTCYFDGEIYEYGSECVFLGEDKNTANANWIINSFRKKKEWSFLVDVDGVFDGVLIDNTNNKVHFFNDHFGLRRLYYYTASDFIVWSSEVKTFIGLEEFNLEIDPVALTSFFINGSLDGTTTWFQGVQLMPPATVLSWDVEKNKFITYKYWNGNDLWISSPITVNYNEAIHNIGELFEKAVAKRIKNGNRIGIPLSGGLDSRAVLAVALKYVDQKIHTHTFGIQESLDILIARRVSSKAGTLHRETFINNDNWFKNKMEAVWITDGQLDLRHMHGSVDIYEYSNVDIGLSGVLGGGIIGGLFQSSWPSISPIDVLANRIRRFSGESQNYTMNFLAERYPFYDIKLICYLLRIQNFFLKDSILYNKMLVSKYPKFFRWIPWQETGLPASFPVKLHKIAASYHKVINLTKKKIFKIEKFRGFQNYQGWLRGEIGKELINDLLHSPNNLYQDFLPFKMTKMKINVHLKGKNDYTDFICRLLTFELWLQQIKTNK